MLDVWGKTTSYWYLEQIKTLEKNFGFDAHTPWKKLPKKIKDIILYGSGGKKIDYDVKRENARVQVLRSPSRA